MFPTRNVLIAACCLLAGCDCLFPYYSIAPPRDLRPDRFERDGPHSGQGPAEAAVRPERALRGEAGVFDLAQERVAIKDGRVDTWRPDGGPAVDVGSAVDLTLPREGPVPQQDAVQPGVVAVGQPASRSAPAAQSHGWTVESPSGTDTVVVCVALDAWVSNGVTVTLDGAGMSQVVLNASSDLTLAIFSGFAGSGQHQILVALPIPTALTGVASSWSGVAKVASGPPKLVEWGPSTAQPHLGSISAATAEALITLVGVTSAASPAPDASGMISLFSYSSATLAGAAWYLPAGATKPGGISWTSVSSNWAVVGAVLSP